MFDSYLILSLHNPIQKGYSNKKHSSNLCLRLTTPNPKGHSFEHKLYLSIRLLNALKTFEKKNKKNCVV
ncbi:hypothetical protein BpHYR1_000372 [Brachionus plicatilis]|uniref:Uncharacterized protein n=1 Tax=Brachionus plicatilis TaxID=10195 RepID=A0A3M7Q608_BRAPC|nr:hypothetical protein BpHYR1_000372 [Brachionus plicatilis]